MSEQSNRYLFTGGGTGGHVYPAIAIADELKRREPEASFLYVGVKGKSEEEIVPKRGYEITFVRSRGFPGARPSLNLLKFMVLLSIGILQAIKVLRKYRPTVIVATGGYVSAPILMAWILLKRLKMTDAKAFVQEQNLAPGRLNRLVGKMADRVGVSFAESCRFFPNAEMLGYPVRSEVGGLDRDEARKTLGIPSNAKVLLVFGGSQGARTINRAVVDALPELLKDPNIWVLHGCGTYNGVDYKAERDTKARSEALGLSSDEKERYRLESYLDPIQSYYGAADLVICRAGAGTLTEVALCGLAALVIPKANLPGDHQVKNAQALSSKDAIEVVYERTEKSKEGLIEVVPGDELAKEVLQLLANSERLAEMREKVLEFGDANALQRLADRVQQLSKNELPPLPEYERTQTDKPDLTEMSGGGIVSYLSRGGLEKLSEEDREYLTYRADGYLANNAWQLRNIGVKLVGLLKLKNRLEHLLYLLNDKTPAPLLHRILGGDFIQVGFLRRNGVGVLRKLGVWDQDVRATLILLLQDPYFEVRSEALRVICFFNEQVHGDEEIKSLLYLRLKERNFEVVREAILALAELEEDASIYREFKQFYTHANWRLREAIARGLGRLVERNVLKAEDVQAELDQLLLTSSGFVPHFHLREEMVLLSRALDKGKASVD